MHRPSISLAGGLAVGIGILTGLPAQAHKTEVSGNVAGTWHLEPNHSAKTGEPARVWVALTQQGGRVITLDQCNCTLAVYRANKAAAVPVMQPKLTAISPERFQNIPGAEITFPEVGEYRIVLTGSPTANATFTPFELSYTTVVAAGSASATTPRRQPAVDQDNSEQVPASSDRETVAAPTQINWAFWGIAIAVGGVGLAAIVLLLRQKKLSRHKNNG